MDKSGKLFSAKKAVAKKAVCVVLFLLFICKAAEAQRIICPEDYRDITRRSGLFSLEVGAGVKEWRGRTGTIGAAYYFQSKKNFTRGQYYFPTMLIKGNFDYIRDNLGSDKATALEHGAFTFDLTLGYIPFNIKDIFYPTLLAGPFITNDFLRRSPDAVSADTKNRLNITRPGGLLGLEVIAFFGHPRLAIVAHADQRYVAKDSFWGNKRRYFWIGLRYHFMDVKRLKR